MAQLTQTQRAAIAANSTFQGMVRVWLKNRANFWKDAPTAVRADVNKQMQKRKRFGDKVLNEHGFVDQLIIRFTEYFLMQYTVDPAVLDGDILAESELDTAAFNAAYDFYAKVQPGDDTDLEVDW